MRFGFFVAIAAISSCSLFEGPPPSLIGAWKLTAIDSRPGPPWAFGSDTTLHADIIIVDADHRILLSRLIAASIAPEIGIEQKCTGTWAFEHREIVITLSDACYEHSFAVSWPGGRQFQRTRLTEQWVYRKHP